MNFNAYSQEKLVKILSKKSLDESMNSGNDCLSSISDLFEKSSLKTVSKEKLSTYKVISRVFLPEIKTNIIKSFESKFIKAHTIFPYPSLFTIYVFCTLPLRE